MRKNIIIVAGVGIVIGGIVGYLSADENRHHYHEKDDLQKHTGHETLNTKPGTHTMPDGTVMTEQDHSHMDHMNMAVASERDFLLGMIPHHEEAVVTAREVLARGGSTPEIRTLAENIISAQEQEIASMKAWYETWYGTPYQANGKYMPMMRDLSKLQGDDLDYVFLQDMIVHHEGAIMMAESVTPYITRPEIEALASSIKNTQRQEIETMQRLLVTLEIDMPDLR